MKFRTVESRLVGAAQSYWLASSSPVQYSGRTSKLWDKSVLSGNETRRIVLGTFGLNNFVRSSRSDALKLGLLRGIVSPM